MLPWHWFSSKSSTPQVEPSVVAATAEEPTRTPTTDTVPTPDAVTPADPEPTIDSAETTESDENSEETETTSTPLTIEEQLAAAKARMKRSSMVADALPSDAERPGRASMTGQRLRRLTSSGAPSPDKESGSKRRHSKQSSMEARPGAPRRSSSVKNVLNAYYKIFGGKPPSKPPAAEQPVEEADRLRKVVRRYEKQLEEASNTIMLQDKVLQKWESKAKVSLKHSRQKITSPRVVPQFIASMAQIRRKSSFRTTLCRCDINIGVFLAFSGQEYSIDVKLRVMIFLKAMTR